MDKDEVLSGLDSIVMNTRFSGISSDDLDDIRDEVGVLYAKLARVEALQEKWTKFGTNNSYDKNRCAYELREALGEKEVG